MIQSQRLVRPHQDSASRVRPLSFARRTWVRIDAGLRWRVISLSGKPLR